MTLKRAVLILKKHQAWRLGAEIEMVNPKALTEALAVIINHFKTLK